MISNSQIYCHELTWRLEERKQLKGEMQIDNAPG